MPLHQTCLLILCHSQMCLLAQCIYIRHACRVHLFRYRFFKVLLHQARNLVCKKIHQTCLQVRCGSKGMHGSRNFRQGGGRGGGPGQSNKKAQLTLQKSNGQFQRNLSFFKVPEGVKNFPGGVKLFQGGSNCLFPI